MTDLRARFAAAAALSALVACSSLSLPGAASAHPSKTAIAAATSGAMPARHVSRLKRLRRH